MTLSQNDSDLARQPAGYWTWAAATSILREIRATLAQVGLTQPQWWVLNQLTDPEGARTRADMVTLLQHYQDQEAVPITVVLDQTRDRGWNLEDPDGSLALTPAGRAVFDRAVEVMEPLRAKRHAGISDEDYVRTLRVLARLTENTGGRAWHH